MSAEFDTHIPEGVVMPLSEVSPNTLFEFPDKFGIWFRQTSGIVAPNGATPIPFGDPEIEIVETVVPDPEREANRWRRRNRDRAEIMNILTNDASGDSTPTNKQAIEFYLAWRGRKLDEGELMAMQDEGILREGYTTPGLSIHAEARAAYKLTSQGMALAVRKGVERKLAITRMATLRRTLRNPSPIPRAGTFG